MSNAARLMELEDQIATAHNQAAMAADAGEECAAYEWRQEASALAQELMEARIVRPFDNYADLYGDYDY